MLHLDLYNVLTSCWLDSVALGTMRACIDQTLQITVITSSGLKQLLMDLRKCIPRIILFKCFNNFSIVLGYLFSVLEDFGLKDLVDFRDMIELLESDEDKYEEIARHKPARMATTIRTMRRL